MKSHRLLLFVSCLSFSVLSAGADRTPPARPALFSRIRAGIEVYGIVHWGLNTFTNGETDTAKRMTKKEKAQ